MKPALKKAGGRPLTAVGPEGAQRFFDRPGSAHFQLESLQVSDRTPRGMEERLSVEEETTATVGDMIVDPLAEQEYQRVLDDIENREVRTLAEQLGERERTVILAHYGLGQAAQTLSQIGASLGLTAERARQIEVGALTKLREALSHSALPEHEPT